MTLFATLIISIVIPSFLVLVGSFTGRLGNQSVGGGNHGQDHPEVNGGWLDKDVKRGTGCGRCAPSMATWPKFYAFFFVFMPLMYGIFAGNAVKDSAENAILIESKKGEKMEVIDVAGFEYIYLAVWFFTLVPFIYFLTILQHPLSKRELNWVFETLPLNYGTRLAANAGMFAVSTLVTGTFILNADIDDETDEGLANLFKASICGCWALGAVLGYEGFCKLFDSFYFGTMPGMRYLWFLGFCVSSVMTLVYLSLTDDLIMYHMVASYGLFLVLPTIIWLLFSRTAVLAGGEGFRTVRTVTIVPPPVSQRELYTARFAMRGSRSTELGASHWIWQPSRPHHLPISACTVRVPTSLDANTRLMTNMALLEPTFIGAAEDSPMTWVRPFLTPFILPFILLALAVHQFVQYVGSITLSLEKEKDLWVLVTPPVGRVINTAGFDTVIYLVDGPGVIAGLGHLQTAMTAGNAGQGQFSDQKFRFVFKIDNVFDFGTLVYGIDQILTGHDADFALNNGSVEFLVLITDGLPTTDNLVGGDKLTKQEAFKNRCVVSPKCDFLNVDLAAMHQGDKAENVCVVAIGSSIGTLQARDLVNTDRSKGITFYDVVYEDSMFRMPIQNDPF